MDSPIRVQEENNEVVEFTRTPSKAAKRESLLDDGPIIFKILDAYEAVDECMYARDVANLGRDSHWMVFEENICYTAKVDNYLQLCS